MVEVISYLSPLSLTVLPTDKDKKKSSDFTVREREISGGPDHCVCVRFCTRLIMFNGRRLAHSD